MPEPRGAVRPERLEAARELPSTTTIQCPVAQVCYGARVRVVWALSSLLASVAAMLACQGRERPPTFDGDGISAQGGEAGIGDDADDAGCEGPPPIENTCGAQIVTVQQQKPTLYFVLDVSGSMNDPLGPRKPTKIASAKQSIIAVVEELGHRVRYGLSTFPGPDEPNVAEGCGPGREDFETQEGDPLVCLNRPATGPVLESFVGTILNLRAVGNTPLASSLARIAPTILSLDGPTAVILLTDGAPNCNTTTRCGPEQCVLSLAGYEAKNGTCSSTNNCCDPDLTDDTGVKDPLSWCIDGPASVGQVEDLAAAGVPTYVVGIPGAEVFSDVMNQLAIAGGTARSGPVAFFDTTDTDELTETLRTIGGEIAQSCELSLKQRPQDSNLFNVYFDAAVIPRDPANGWSLTGDIVRLHGNACAQVSRGDVSEIRMISGCTTVVK